MFLRIGAGQEKSRDVGNSATIRWDKGKILRKHDPQSKALRLEVRGTYIEPDIVRESDEREIEILDPIAFGHLTCRTKILVFENQRLLNCALPQGATLAFLEGRLDSIGSEAHGRRDRDDQLRRGGRKDLVERCGDLRRRKTLEGRRNLRQFLRRSKPFGFVDRRLRDLRGESGGRLAGKRG